MNIDEYLFTCTGEESAEIGQAVSKILRFGLDDINPNTNQTNRVELVKEFNDLVGVLELIQERGIELPGLFDRNAIEQKKLKVIKYAEISKKLGRLQ